MELMGRPAPSPAVVRTTSLIQLSQFDHHMLQFLKFPPKQTQKISRAFGVVSRGRLLACYLNVCWDCLLGGFHMRMAKKETDNFASVWCCFTRTHLGFSPQFLLGKLAWGLSYVHGQAGTCKFRERSVLFHADVLWLDASIFAGKACLGALICAWH